MITPFQSIRFHRALQWAVVGLTGMLILACGEKKTCDKTVDTISQVDGSSTTAFHDNHTRAAIAQGFRPDEGLTLNSIVFAVKKVGDPPGELRFSIHKQDGARPDEDDIDGGSPQTFQASALETDFFKNVEIEFPAEPDLDANRVYYLVIESQEPVNADNYFLFASSSVGSAYANGTLLKYDEDIDDLDDAWSAESQDLQFTVKRCETVN